LKEDERRRAVPFVGGSVLVVVVGAAVEFVVPSRMISSLDCLEDLSFCLGPPLPGPQPDDE
jgi:hypothetical protein